MKMCLQKRQHSPFIFFPRTHRQKDVEMLKRPPSPVLCPRRVRNSELLPGDQTVRSSLPVLKSDARGLYDSTGSAAARCSTTPSKSRCGPLGPPPEQGLRAALTRLLRALVPNTGPGRVQVVVVLQAHHVIFTVNPR